MPYTMVVHYTFQRHPRVPCILYSDSSLLHPQLALTQPSLLIWLGCATTVLVTGAGIGEMVLQMLVGLVGGVLWGWLGSTPQSR